MAKRQLSKAMSPLCVHPENPRYFANRNAGAVFLVAKKA
jgi:hypothetical protein